MAGYQIIGVRTYFDEKTRTQKRYDAFYENRWRYDDPTEIFRDPIGVLNRNNVPESERYNLYYTISNCGDAKREMVRLEQLAIDVDGLDVSRLAEYLPVVKGIIGGKPTVVASGNGLHFILQLAQPIERDQHEGYRAQYKAILNKINRELERLRLPGKGDPAVWDKARILRIPGTKNVKPDKTDPTKLVERECRVLELGDLAKVAFDWDTVSGAPKLDSTNAISEAELRKYRTNDGAEAMQQCAFLRHAAEDAASLSEPEWYAAASIVGRFKDGAKLFHEISRGHTGYTPTTTDEKLDQALSASGPRTCQNINNLWGKCSSCPMFGKVKSPIAIISEDAIRTEASGFYDIIPVEGKAPKIVPNYGDLLKAFQRDNPYFCDGRSERIYRFDTTHWGVMFPAELKAFAEEKFDPDPKEAVRTEFAKKVLANNVWKPGAVENFLYSRKQWRVNLRNCVVDPLTLETSPHSPDFGLTYVLPYDYVPEATAPTFLKFIDDVTLGRKDLQETLLDFLAYVLVPRYDDHCFLWLSGGGRNGKSSYTKVLEGIAGSANSAHVLMDQFEDPFSLSQLNHKLVNFSEESENRKIPAKTMARLKLLSAGGTLSTSEKNEKNFSMPNTAKLVFLSNTIPSVDNVGQAIASRMIAVPFDMQLEDFRDPTAQSKVDATLDDKLAAELPGILNLALTRIRARAGAPFKVHRSQTGREYAEEIFRNSNTVEKWIHECAVVKPEVKAWAHDLYADYTNFVDDSRYAAGFQSFVTSLRRRQGIRLSERIRRDSQRGYEVFGIALKADKAPASDF